MDLINSFNSEYCFFLCSKIGVGVGNGKLTIINEESISPGQSTPSQNEPVAKRTPFPLFLKVSAMFFSLFPSSELDILFYILLIHILSITKSRK